MNSFYSSKNVVTESDNLNSEELDSFNNLQNAHSFVNNIYNSQVGQRNDVDYDNLVRTTQLASTQKNRLSKKQQLAVRQAQFNTILSNEIQTENPDNVTFLRFLNNGTLEQLSRIAMYNVKMSARSQSDNNETFQQSLLSQFKVQQISESASKQPFNEDSVLNHVVANEDYVPNETGHVPSIIQLKNQNESAEFMSPRDICAAIVNGSEQIVSVKSWGNLAKLITQMGGPRHERTVKLDRIPASEKQRLIQALQIKLNQDNYRNSANLFQQPQQYQQSDDQKAIDIVNLLMR